MKRNPSLYMYKFSDKDGLDFTFIWIHDRGDRRGGNTRRVREELVLRIQNGGLTTPDHQHDTEKGRKTFFIEPIFDRNLNLQMGKSFNFL